MRYLSSKEVSEILGVNISTLKRWTNTGLIGCQKTAGGHRKFTMQHVRDYYKKNHNHGKNTDLGLETKAHKNIYEHINKSNFKELRTRTFILVHAVLGVLKSSLTNRQDVDPDDIRKELKSLVLHYCLN